MNCPHCKKLTSDIGKTCVHCGKELQESVVRKNTVPVKCPLCNVNTDIIDLAGVELDYCYECNGIWFDKGEIEVFQNAVSDLDVCRRMQEVLNDLSQINGKTERSHYLCCPVCLQRMSQKKFADVSDIILDQCAEHGTWTEKEDLAGILRIIGSGEIDELIARATRMNQQTLERRLKEIESKNRDQDAEITRVRSASRIHLFLDILGFT